LAVLLSVVLIRLVIQAVSRSLGMFGLELLLEIIALRVMEASVRPVAIRPASCLARSISQGLTKSANVATMQRKNLTAVAVFILGMATAAAANESENGAGLKWLVGFGLTHGGDELAEIELDFDGDSSDEDLRGGDLITLAAGPVVYLPLPAWSLQMTIGYHFDEVSCISTLTYGARASLFYSILIYA